MANENKKNVNVKVSADTKEAIRSLREMERQVNKLGDLADQGAHRQDGFLSAKQVQMYKRILKEMEKTYEQHNRKLSEMQDKYDRQQNSKEQKKLKDLENEVKKRQQLLRNAEGGNKWGDVSSPIIQEYHRKKLGDAEQNLKDYKSSDEFKKAVENSTQLEADLNTLRQAVSRLQEERNRSNTHSDSINNMHQFDPNTRRMIHQAGDAVSATGAIVSAHSYWNYTQNGIDLLRQQERATNTVALRGGYNVGGQVDGELRRDNYKLGEAQYYDTYDTAMQQQAIISGGTTGDEKALQKDTTAVQRFGRAYAMDATEFANDGAMLQRMGTLKEGEQQRFANMLAGAIAKGGMNGRQEEMLRATTALVQSVSQGQAQFTDQQLKNVMGLQTAVGNAVPSLKGERGAQVLATMDSAIKNGGSQLDLLMGKGTEFVGLSGMTKLEELKEQGLSNPENLQRVLKGAKRMFGGNEDMTKWALKEQLGLQMNEYDALKKSGLLDQIMKDPNSITSTDLEKAGAKDLAKQWNTYANSETAQVDKADSRAKNLQASHAQVADEIAKKARNTWHDLPDWAQHTILPLSALGGVALGSAGGGVLRRRLTNWMTRTINPNIGGGGGLLSRMGGWARGAGNWVKGLFAGGEGGGSLLSKAGSLGKKVLGPAGELFGLDWLAKGGDNVYDWAFGHSKGDIKKKSGIFHNPFGDLTDGTYKDDKQGAISKAWDWITGADNSKSSSSDKKTKKVPTDNSTADAKVNTIDAGKININNKDLASYFEKQSSKKDTSATKSNNDNVIKIQVEGKIDGMTSKNEDDVASSIKDYFTTAFSYSNNPFKFNLSLDQNRT